MSGHDRVGWIFHQVVDLDAGRQAEMLSMLCGEDRSLRAEVESLLGFDRPDGAASGDVVRSTRRAGDAVGPYRLESLLGIGGFGEVWRARQETPIERSVAVKIVAATQTTGVRDEERQLLSRLRHPGIARLLEVGTLPDGAAWSAMELVEGRPFLEGIEELGDLRQRVDLLVQACEAIASAHRVGVIHLDLKSGNILVGRDPADGGWKATVIDFGVGRLLGASGVPDRRIVGTPGAMAPEQAAGGSLDTRVDIWALGRLLDRLREGASPVTARASRELGWIIDRATHDDPERRFGTVDSMVAELHRWLAGEPLLECGPDTAWRRIETAWRRHRLPIAAAFVVLGGLVATIGGVRGAQLEAEAAQARAERTLAFVRALFGEVDQSTLGSPATSWQENLYDALARVEVDAAGDPLAEAALRLEAARFASLAGDPDLMAAFAESALELQSAVLDRRDGRLDETRYELARARYNQGRFEEAATILESLLVDFPSPTDVTDPPSGMSWFIFHATVTSLLPDGGSRAVDMLSPWLPVVPEGEPEGGSLRKSLGTTLVRVERAEEAVPHLESALDEVRGRFPEAHPAVLWRRLGLGVALLEAGRVDAARSHIESASEGLLDAVGPNHPSYLAAVERQGDLALVDGDPRKARARWSRAFHGLRGHRSDDHPSMRRLDDKIRRHAAGGS